MIVIPQSIQDEMIAHSKELFPIESCGYLAAEGETVKKLYKMTNLDEKEDHFTFDPKEQFAVVKEARANGWQLISVYHSHPSSPARLSQEDLKLLVDPNMIYVIVSLENQEHPDIKAYQTRDHQSIDVPIHDKEGL